MDDNNGRKAVCERNGEEQRIDLIDLPLPRHPRPAPNGLPPYRPCLEAGGFAEHEEEGEDE